MFPFKLLEWNRWYKFSCKYFIPSQILSLSLYSFDKNFKSYWSLMLGQVFILIGKTKFPIQLFSNTVFTCHMGDSTQPQQKHAGTGENCNTAIPVIPHPVTKTLWKFMCPLVGCASTQISYSRAKMNLANTITIVQKFRKLPDFWAISNTFAKSLSAPKSDIRVPTDPNNKHNNFHKASITGQKMTGTTTPQPSPAPAHLRCG